MTTALIYFSASVLVLIILSSLYIVEDVRGKRIVLVRLRDLLDVGIMKLLVGVRTVRHFVWDSFVHIILRYGLHTFLGAVLAFLRRLEQRVEGAVKRNRQAVRGKRRERNHLDEIAEHKEETALSDQEKQRRRQE